MKFKGFYLIPALPTSYQNKYAVEYIFVRLSPLTGSPLLRGTFPSSPLPSHLPSFPKGKGPRMFKPRWTICGFHKPTYLRLSPWHQILINAFRLFQVQRQQFRGIKLLKDVYLKSFHSKPFIPHEFLPLGGTQAWNTTCLSKPDNWATLKIYALLVPSNSTGNPSKVQAHGWTWQMYSDRNLITREKDTYIGQP